MRVSLFAVGLVGVGKSSLLLSFVDGSLPACPNDVFTKREYVERTIRLLGRSVKVRLTDTCGQERFMTLPSSTFRGVEGILFVYDVTNEESFNTLNGFMENVELVISHRHLPKILVGNKCDLENKRKITYERGAAFAKARNMSFYETSAVDMFNIEEIFVELVADILQKKQYQD